MTGQTSARTPVRVAALLRAIILAGACALALNATPAQAAKLLFGTGEHLVQIQDIDMKGPNGEALYLGYKYSLHAFLAPYHVSDDGYVLGVRGENKYFKLDEAKIKTFQAAGLLPSPLPPYQLSALTYVFGYSFWGILLIIVGSIPLAMLGKRRRKRALPHLEGAFADHRGGNLDQAIDGYTRAIEIDPKLAIALHLRGNAFQQKGDVRKAISDYTKAVQIEPKFAQALLDRGILLRNESQFETAISDFTRVVKLAKDAPAYVQRGYTYLAKGDADRAITDFTQAIKLAPEFADAYRYRAAAYERKGDAASARADQARANALVGDAGLVQQPVPQVS